MRAPKRPSWSFTSARSPRTRSSDTSIPSRRAGGEAAMRRTAVTGVGVVAPGGATREAFWDAITAGRTATRRITFFDPSGFRSQIAAECEFDPKAAGLNDQEIRRMDRYIQFTV